MGRQGGLSIVSYNFIVTWAMDFNAWASLHSRCSIVKEDLIHGKEKVPSLEALKYYMQFIHYSTILKDPRGLPMQMCRKIRELIYKKTSKCTIIGHLPKDTNVSHMFLF